MKYNNITLISVFIVFLMLLSFSTAIIFNTSTGESSFNGTMNVSQANYTSYFFNTSEVVNATSVAVNLTWSDSSKDLDLFLFDNSNNLKAKSFTRGGSEYLTYSYLPENEIWEIRVYGNLSAAENYTGYVYISTLNAINSSSGSQLGLADFGIRNFNDTEQLDITLQNIGGVNATSLAELQELYYTETQSASGSHNYTLLVPTFVEKVESLLNWTGTSNYTVNIYWPNGTLASSSNDKQEATGVLGEKNEFASTTTIVSSPTNLWTVEVINNSGTDTFTLENRLYINESEWLSSNYSTTSINSGETKTYHINLTVPSTALSGLYEGFLRYHNNQSLKIPLRINVSTPTLSVNNTFQSATKTLDENIGFNRTGSDLSFNLTINNTGNSVLNLGTSNSTSLNLGSNYMNLSYSYPSSINPGSSGTLSVNVTINTADTGNNEGVYTGWIYLNSSDSHPYNGFNLTINVNLTNDLSGTLSHTPTLINPSSANNVTFTVDVQLANGSSISNSLNMSNFLSAWITEKNVTSYSQTLTNLVNLSATPCTGGVCKFNATVPANLVGGRYKLSVNITFDAADGTDLLGVIENATTLIINDTGLNLTLITSDNVSINEGDTAIINVSVTNFGPVKADDLQITFDKGSCSITSSTKDSSAAVLESGSTFTVDIDDGETQWFRWTITGSSVSSNSACSDAKVTVDQTSFNNITGISFTVKDTDSQESTDSSTSSSSSSSDSTTVTITKSISIEEFEDNLEIIQGESISTEVVVKNKGDVSLDVDFSVSIDGVDVNVSPSSTQEIKKNETETYTVEFTVSENSSLGEIEGTFKAETDELEDSKSFTLIVLPSESSKKLLLSDKDANREILDNLKSRFIAAKTGLCVLSDSETNITTNITKLISQIDALLNDSEDILTKMEIELKDEDFIEADKEGDKFDTRVKEVISKIEELEAYKKECVEIGNKAFGSLLLYAGVGVVILILVGLFLYSYYPSGYRVGSGYGVKRINLFKEAGRIIKAGAERLGALLKREEKVAQRTLKHFEQEVSRDYGKVSGYVRREIGYEFEQLSIWTRLKNKLFRWRFTSSY